MSTSTGAGHYARPRPRPEWGSPSVRGALAVVIGSMVATVLLLVASASAYAASSTTRDEPPRPRLLVVGDSVVLGTYDNIPRALPGWDVTVDAAVSRSTTAGLTALLSHGDGFNAVVIELGTNDAETPGVFQPRAVQVMNAVANVPKVYWLTIHEARPYYAQANAIIRAEAAARPNVAVIDWNAAVAPGDVGEDGLHLTPAGSVHMAALIAGAVNAGTVPPPTTAAPTTEPLVTTTIPPAPTSTVPATTTTLVQATTTTRVNSVASATRQQPTKSTSAFPVWAWIAIGVLLVALGAAALVVRVRKNRPETGVSDVD